MRRNLHVDFLRPLLGFLYLGLLLLPALLCAQSEDSPASGPPAGPPRTAGSIVQADRLEDRVVEGEKVTFLLGNVFIDRDTMTVRSDTARYYRDRELYELWGRVRMRQNEAVLTCRRALYRRTAGAADFHGEVRIEEEGVIGTADRGESRQEGQYLRLIDGARLISPEYTVWADTISRDKDISEGEATGNVKIIDQGTRTLVTGDHATFDSTGDSAYVDRNPRLTSRDRGSEAFEGRSEEMLFFRRDQRVVMMDSVRIHQGRTQAIADTAIVLGQERLLLRGNPQVQIGKQSTMIGDEIEFRYRNQKLYRIYLRGAARMEDASPDSLAALYSGLPEVDILEGDTITVEIAEDQLQRSVVIGHAHSLYVPTDITDEVAYNDVRGDTIILYFRNEQVNRVSVSGDMTGKYTFARIAELAPPESGGFAAADSAAGVESQPVPVAPTEPTEPTAAETALPGSPAPPVLDFEGGAEMVDYSGGSVLFRLAQRSIEIKGDSELTYDTMTLTAEEVRFDTVDRELYARGDPLLTDSGQKMAGENMGYNFEHKTGAVRDGVTSFDGNYYVGKNIKRFGDGTMKIQSGKMTSCDLERPHYHFWSDKMKVRMKDQLVAKPVVLKIGQVPLFAVPFYFKSLKEGRRSGILFPTFNFGWSRRTGRYIRDFGYYWATNDYTDFSIEGDYNERENFSFQISNRYVKRYNFRGNVTYSRRSGLGDQEGGGEWRLVWSHDQERLFDEYSLRANVNMASPVLTSNDLSRETGRDIRPGQLNSDLTLNRSWPFMNSTLSLSRTAKVYSSGDLDDPTDNNELYTLSPRLSLSPRQINLLPSLARGKDGSLLGDLLRNTSLRHGYNFQATKRKRELTTSWNYNGSGNAALSVRPPRLGIFNFSTGVSSSYRWERQTEKGESFEGTETDRYFDGHDSVVVVTENVFAPVDTETEKTTPSLSVNSSLGTTLYGIFPIRLGKLRAIRHTLRLSAGHTYRPALADKQKRSESYSFNLNNRFDVKYLSGSQEDSTGQEKKVDGLLDWSLSTGYNPDAEPDQRWGNISSSITIQPGQSRNLNLKVGNSIDPYIWKVLTTRLTYGLNLTGKFDTGGTVLPEEGTKNRAIERLGAVADSTEVTPEGILPEEEEDPYLDDFAGFQRPLTSGREGKDPTEGGRFMPWNLSASLSFNRNHNTEVSTANANFSVTASPSRNWEFSYRTSVDFVTGEFNRQEWSLKRDVHCWRLEFTRIVRDFDPEYGFRFYLRAIPAIELTRGNDQLLGSLPRNLGGSIY